MQEIYIYMIRSAISMALLYAGYRLLIHNNTYFRLRRFVLLGILAFSALFQFVAIPDWMNKYAGLQIVEPAMLVMLPEVMIDGKAASGSSFISMLPVVIWLAGSLILLIRFLSALVGFFLARGRSEISYINGQKIYIMKGEKSAFSFFRMIFITPSDYEGAQLSEILLHERTHSRQLHSLDVIIGELFTIIFWINPFVWLIKQEIRINLEHLADSSVVDHTEQPAAYQYNLLSLCHTPSSNKLVNNFNISQLKRRIKMMNTNKSNRSSLMRYLLLLPIAALVVLACNNNDQPVDDVSLKSPVSESASTTEEVFTVVEEMPKFPGGDKELLKYIGSKIQYPVEAQEKSIQGRVIASFMIEKDGSISNVQIVRGVYPLLDAEAIRVIESMPDWTPGRQKGEAVRVKYTIPVTFRME